MNWKVFFIFGCSACLANSIPGYHPPLQGSSLWGYFTPSLTHRVPSKTAMEAMVDLTNNLGVAILQDHSYSRGNFAFSPYGVASVLVVLYEGARGESARQIHTAVGFPSDKDIIRIGFRNIHRHLRSYFSHEGYLSGISLNKDSSSLRSEYKKILRFYGYDIDLSQPSEDDANDENSASQSSTFEPSGTTVHSTVTQYPTLVTSSKPSTEKVKNDTKPSSEKNETKTTIQPATTEGATQQFENSSKHDTEEPKKTTTIASTTTSYSSEGMSGILSSTEPEKTKSITALSTVIDSQEEKTSTASTASSENDDELNLNLAVEENSASGDGKIEIKEQEQEEERKSEEGNKDKEEKENTEQNKKEEDSTGQQNKKEEESTSEQEAGGSEMPTEGQETSPNPATESSDFSWANPVTDSETQKTGTKDAVMDLDNGMLIPQLGDTETTPTERFTTTTDMEGMSSLATDITTQFFEEFMKSERNGKGALVQNEILVEDKIKMPRNTIQVEEDISKRIRSIINTKVPLWLGNMKKPNSRVRRTLTDYLKSPHSPDLSLQLQNGMYDTHISRNADLYRSLPRLLFLVDGAVDTPVPMMTYTNVFPYAYIPRLHAKALEFPLDDIRYKLLILLPVERRGLRQLIYDLADFPLSNVLMAVQPTRVKAMVPTFMVEGFVILTSSLQKLGIWDVFDPRKANLSAMSLDPELYVRNVEQSVTVVIRNYVEILDIQTRTMAARQMEHDFEATHPFLYFVLDTATNTALMAGQILDPLNSRIY